jgi:hypothetical protein
MICDTCPFSQHVHDIIERGNFKHLMLGIVIGGMASSLLWLAVMWGGK